MTPDLVNFLNALYWALENDDKPEVLELLYRFVDDVNEGSIVLPLQREH